MRIYSQTRITFIFLEHLKLIIIILVHIVSVEHEKALNY